MRVIAGLRRRTWGIVGLGLIWLLYALACRASPMDPIQGDGYYTYLWARTIVFDFDLDFANDYQICGDPWGLRASPVGTNVNYWNMGPALFWIPGLAAARLESWLENDSRQQGCLGESADDAAYGSLFAALFTALVGYVFARRRWGDGVAIVAAAAIALCTSLTYYAVHLQSYGHAASSFGCGLFVLAWDVTRQNRGWKGWALCGAALGLAMLMRSQNAILAVLPLADWLHTAWTHARERRWRAIAVDVGQGVVFALIALLVFAPQMVAFHSMTGSFFTVSQGEHYLRWDTPNIPKALFSTANGLFPWAPIHYPAVAGLVLLALRRSTRVLGLGLLAVFLIDAYVVSCVWDWWGSIGYPGRRFDLIAVPMMIGLAALLAQLRGLWQRRPRVVAAIAALAALSFGAYWNYGVDYLLAKGGRTDIAEPAPQKYTPAFEHATRELWEEVGNPWAWPASIPFAIRWNAHPRRWDVVGGPELFYHQHQTLERREYESTMDFAGEPRNLDYLDGTVEGAVGQYDGARGVRAYQGRVRVLMPLHYPDAGALQLSVATGHPARVRMHVNGMDAGMEPLTPGGIRRVRWQLAPGTTHHGINEVWLTIRGSAIVIQKLEILDRDPPPSVEQARRNAALRAALSGRPPPPPRPTLPPPVRVPAPSVAPQ